MNTQKRIFILTLALCVALVLLLTACGKSGDMPSGDNSTPDVAGTYEGEHDASGRRSGYGVWIYDNFRYEGYFENDMPNGEGTLYENSLPPANRDPSRTYTSKIIVRGNWVDGFSNGAITLSWVMESGETHTWVLDTANGYPMRDGEVYTADGLTNLSFTRTWLIGGVPPWAKVETDSAVAPPSGNDQPGAPSSGTSADAPAGDDSSGAPLADEAVTPQRGTVSVAGTYYASRQVVYALPEGMSCAGSVRDEEAKVQQTMWLYDYGTDTGKVIGITEHDDVLTDYDTRTDDQWFELCFRRPVDATVKELKAVKTTVDGHRAVRLTFSGNEEGNADSAYMEAWVIDAPGGYIDLVLLNAEICEDYDLHSQWAADITATIRFR